MQLTKAEELFLFDKTFGENKLILGVDEAGRGPGAGDVFASCVCFLNYSPKLLNLLEKLNDSKKLTPKTREYLYEIIINNSIYSIKSASIHEIEKYNILNASLLAMKRAILDVVKIVGNKNVHIIIDGNKTVKNIKYDTTSIIKGDFKSASIAAASILAKVFRDRYMVLLHNKYPEYNWAKNKGYLTLEHLQAIKKYGIVKYHRKSFLKKYINENNNSQ